MKCSVRLVANLCVLVLGTPPIGAQDPVRVRPAIPLEPIAAIIDAFSSHSIVALDEGAHGNAQGHAFRLALIRDPRFATVVNDIVVEFGNARYQDLMDRYVRGEEVSDDVLKQVWRNTTQAHTVWDVPIYEEFFRTVREVNRSLPTTRHLRVLLGDPPVDWAKVTRWADLDPWLAERDHHPAELVRREVIEKQRRALLIFGSAHIFRVPMDESVVHLIRNVIDVFTIATPISMPTAKDLRVVQSDVDAWPVPSLTLIRGTTLGETDFNFYYPPPMVLKDGKAEPVVPAQWRSLTLEDQADALLYLGPPCSIQMSRLPATLCADDTYLTMRLQRMALNPYGQGQLEGLRRYCASQTPR